MPPPAPPASKHLPIEQHPIPQADTLLCWAATSQMVIEHFFPVPPRAHLSQWTLSGFREARVDVWMNPEPQALVDAIATCEKPNGPCNVVSTPRLVGLACKFRQTPLTKDEIKRELGVEQRPFIFQWFLPGLATAERASGNHYLIATGYDDGPGGFTLTVWDPWPVATRTAVSRLPKRITLGQYRSTGNFMGVDISYAETFWKIGLRPVRAMMSGPPVRPRRRRRGAIGGGVALSRAATTSLSAPQRARILRRLERLHQLDQPARTPIELTIGTPFPIVAVDIDTALAARDEPLKLLEPRSRAVLYPVLIKDKAVIDGFIMSWIGGRWVERGYANTAVTALAHEWRRIEARRRPGMPADALFYLVSVPEVRGFFVGIGEGERAELIPVSDDRDMGLVEGRPLGARHVLGAVVRRVQQLTSPPPGSPGRPGGPPPPA